MYEISKEMLFAIVAIPILLVATFLVIPLDLVSGLIGILPFAALVLIVKSWNGDEPPARINCSECGAPNELESDRCTHCNVSLESVGDT